MGVEPIGAGPGIIERHAFLGDDMASSNDSGEGAQTSAPMLALDVGDKRIGVAVSDRSGMLATPVETVHRKNTKVDVARIAEIALKHEVAGIVVGLPKNVDGSEGEQADKVKSFARKLMRATGLPVHLEDERFSTSTAIERLVERGVKTGHNRDLVDMEAAAIILQSFLDRRRQ